MPNIKTKKNYNKKNLDDYGCQVLKQVRIYRHGQAEHNLEDPNGKILPNGKRSSKSFIKDSLLTDNGKEDAKAIDLKWLQKSKNRIAFVSPLKRTLQTATIAIETNKIKIDILSYENLREVNNHHKCNHRGKLKDTEFLFKNVDFSLIKSQNGPKSGLEIKKDFRDVVFLLRKRSKKILEFLKERKETDIAIFSHGRLMASLLTEIMNINKDYTIDPPGNGEYILLLLCKDKSTKKVYWTVDTKTMKDDKHGRGGSTELKISKILPNYDS